MSADRRTAARTSRWLALAESCDSPVVAQLRADRPGDLGDVAFALAAAIAAAYPALRHLAWVRPEIFETIAREGLSSERRRPEFLRRLRAAIDATGSVRRGLRQASELERVRIAARELDGFSSGAFDVDVTAREWSELAEAQIEIALVEARAHIEARFGHIFVRDGDITKRARFVVYGLGKLGGRELNAGSDVDLVYVHESDDGFASKDPASGADAITPRDAFARIGRRLAATLEDHDDDGFCARVDLRLRPEGTAGPLSISLPAAVAYYESFGRPWERAALLRARPIAGDIDLGQELMIELAPFVYRRSVDPSIARDMRDMVRRARTEVSDDPSRDLKLGVGGIREAEFFVQTLQLVWGGRDARVRSTRTLAGLRKLRTRGYVTDREAREIESAYLLLRRLEHRVQLATGLQTHLLPDAPIERERLARSLGVRSWSDLSAQLDRARTRVSQRFSSLVPSGDTPVEDTLVEQVLAAIDVTSAAHSADTPLPPQAIDPTTRAHASTPEPLSIAPELLAAFKALARRSGGALGATTIARHPPFARRLVRTLLDAADPERAATLVRSFFDRLAPPSVDSYVRMLADDERALTRLVGVCGASAYLGQALVGHPELADRLLFGSRVGAVDEARARALLDEELASLPDDQRHDAESFAGALRRAKSAIELEAGLADLADEARVDDVARALTGMADATLDAATRWATDELLRKRGIDPIATPLAGLAILALGKLGVGELGFGSDLDVVFVYDPRAIATTALEITDAPEIFGRIAARVIRLISTPHADGPGYELDTRLRPSGEQGHLVVSIDAFSAYHRGERRAAATWERQALTRVRACAGDAIVGACAVEIATESTYFADPPSASEMLAMRLRMEREIGREREGVFDVKVGRGGVADVDFAVQFLQLREGRHHARVRDGRGTAALDALEAEGFIASSHAATLREGKRFLRRLEQRLRIVHGSKTVRIGEDGPGLQSVARALGLRDRTDQSAAQQLIARYREVTEEVRATLIAVLEPEA